MWANPTWGETKGQRVNLYSLMGIYFKSRGMVAGFCFYYYFSASFRQKQSEDVQHCRPALALHSPAQVGTGHLPRDELPSAGRSVGITQVFGRCSEMSQCPLFWEQMYTEHLLHASKRE